jgi:hypothetical protein
MKKFMIERTIPGAGKLTGKDIADVTAKSNGVLREMGPDIQWVESFVTSDKIYCVYVAKTAELVREHARRGGFPADSVALVTAVIDPTNEELR